MNLIASSGVDVANTTYLWIYVALGVIGLVGAGVALRKYFFKQAVREVAIDALIHPDTGVMARLEKIEKTLSPNGLDTDNVGDIAKRTEVAVRKVQRGLTQHIAAEANARSEIWQELARKQDREVA
jgi:hypothetical protein